MHTSIYTVFHPSSRLFLLLRFSLCLSLSLRWRSSLRNFPGTLRLRVSRAHASSPGRDSGGVVVAVVGFGRPLHPVGFCVGGLSSNPRPCVGFGLPSKNAAAQKTNVLSITLLFYNYFLGFCFFVACISLVSVPFGLCHKDFPVFLEYVCLFVCRQWVECSCCHIQW
jgi:hypothetical protein